MLRNKKTCIRLLALVLALLMTAAIFVGCKDKTALKEAEDAKKQAQAANDAAAEAQKTADSIAKAAEELAKSLQDAKDKADKDAADAKAAADKAQKELDELKKQETQAPIEKDDFNKITDTVSEKALKTFTDMKTLYLTTRELWYTPADYETLAKVFEDASYQLYRATTADGVDKVIADAKVAADKVTNIVSAAAAVQAQIAAFGDVDTKIFTTNKNLVTGARAAFVAWAKAYRPFLVNCGINFPITTSDAVVTAFINGKTVIKDAQGNDTAAYNIHAVDIVNTAYLNTGRQAYINISGTNSLLYAESKIDNLEKYAALISGNIEQVRQIVAAQGVTYINLKANGLAIQQAYDLYKRFYAVNGGDDTPIKATDAAGKVTLTGEQFVKAYILVLFDGQLAEYQQKAYDFVYNKMVSFFMNTGNASALATEINGAIGEKWNENFLNVFGTYTYSYENGADPITPYTTVVDTATGTISLAGTAFSIKADGVQITRDFNRVVAQAYAKIYEYDYTDDFKGSKSLEDAYLEIDQHVIEATIDLASVYYNDVTVPVINSIIGQKLAAYKTAYTTTELNEFYKDQDKKFYTVVEKIWTDCKAGLAKFNTLTYEDLNKLWNADASKYNISQTTMFDMKAMTDPATGCLVGTEMKINSNKNTSSLYIILKALNETVDDAMKYVYDIDVNAVDTVEFYEFRKDLCKELDRLVGLTTTGTTSGVDTKLAVILNDKANNTSSFYSLAAAAAKNISNVSLNITLIEANFQAALYTGRNDIMALDYATYKSSTYQAVNGAGNKLYNTQEAIGSATMTTSSSSNVALNIELDKLVVAKDAAVTKFAETADSFVKILCDTCRDSIKSYVTTSINMYKTNYFGDLDKVSLQKDMNEYIDYLNTLTDLAGVNFKAEYCSNEGDSFAFANGTALGTALADGYFQEVVTANKVYLFHVRGDATISLGTNKMAFATIGITGAPEVIEIKNYYTDGTVAAATTVNHYATAQQAVGYQIVFNAGNSAYENRTIITDGNEGKGYLALAEAKLTEYLGLYGMVNDAYQGLCNVRLLSYYKDNALYYEGIVSSVNMTGNGFFFNFYNNQLVQLDANTPSTFNLYSVAVMYNNMLGTVKDGAWLAAPAFDYTRGTLRTDLYLTRLAETKARIEERISKITMLSSGVNYDLDNAKLLVDECLVDAFRFSSDALASAKSTDDYSFPITWTRYYTDVAAYAYNWTPYMSDK